MLQCLLQTIRPGTREFSQPGLDFLLVDSRHNAFIKAHQDIQTGVGGFGKVGIEFEVTDIEIAGEHSFETFAQCCRVIFAWCIDQARNEIALTALAQEQPQPTPVLQEQHLRRDPTQRLHRHLEQFLARKGLENLHQAFAIMAGGFQPRQFQRCTHLATNERKVTRRMVEHQGREQPDQTHHPARFALTVDVGQGDHVHVHWPMNPGALTRLVEGQHPR